MLATVFRGTVMIILENIMNGFLALPLWSPYLVGVCIGLLVCLAFVLSDRPIGCSTGFVKIRGLAEKIFCSKKIQEKEYYKKFPPAVDWQLMIIPGIIIGAFLSSVLSGTFGLFIIPPLWAEQFGSSAVLRIIAAITGGILLGIGARWAGGCTSGHGISGSLQLSVGSILSSACFFAGGIAMAMILFGVHW
ncbi:MAG TPA: YeeE/YedE thiosulfate transporter family protein [Methanoregulaceae archaeon]|nr:YeeE/YedE thiosulfate transporter family protein [Methanoregulaceae archaeon]HQA79848.1 YeeE/YedE thiosulfate transporter family protein [Methanoregulaceae archaeon]